MLWAFQQMPAQSSITLQDGSGETSTPVVKGACSRAQGGIFDSSGELFNHTVAQFLRGLAGEGDRENLCGRRDLAFAEKPQKSLDQKARFAGARRRFDDP